MKRYGLLLFTWRTVVTGALLIGLLLAVALYAVVLNTYLAFSRAVVTFMHLLGVPYLAAAAAMRKLIFHHPLSIMLNSARIVGLVLLTSLGLLVAALMATFKNPGAESFACAGNWHGAARYVVQNTEQIPFQPGGLAAVETGPEQHAQAES